MKYCKLCGSQLTDNAVYCPKCGTRVETNDENHQVAEDISTSQEERLSTGEKIAIGAAIFLALTGIINGFSRDMWIILIVSLCAMVATLAVCIGAIEKKYAMKTAISALVIVFFTIGIFGQEVKDEGNAEGEDEQAQTSQNAKDESRSSSKDAEEIHKDFFESGYKYSTSYGYTYNGRTYNYKYIIRIFNDGTEEISIPETQIYDPEGCGTKECSIEKKSDSYRDVSATWYEVEFNYSYDFNGKHNNVKKILNIDEHGNIIILGLGKDKNIYEAVATNDCIYGKFKKEKMEVETFRCKTCGKDYDPSKESIYSENYCYMDYPQKCFTCGEIYTVNSTPEQYKNYVCGGTCGECYYEHRERVRGFY